MIRNAILLTLFTAHAVQAAPTCKLDKKKVKWGDNQALLGLDKVLVGARWDAKQGVVLANVETGAAIGKPVALPQSEQGKVMQLVRTNEGFVAVVRLTKKGEYIDARRFLVRFTRDGVVIGEPHELAPGVAPTHLPGFEVASLGSKLALLEETKSLEYTQVQIVDLDGKALGTAVDAEAKRIGLAAPIGSDGKALAVILRDSAGGEERLRVLDVDKNAWVGAATPLPDLNIYGMVAFGKDALLESVGPAGVSGGTVGADGKLGPWKLWRKMGSFDTGGFLVGSPDGTHAYVSYSLRPSYQAKETTLLWSVGADLAVKEVARRPGKTSNATTYTTANAVYAQGDGDDLIALRCR